MHAVGRIITVQEMKGRRENEIAIFTRDNGGSTVGNNDLKYLDDNCPDVDDERWEKAHEYGGSQIVRG